MNHHPQLVLYEADAKVIQGVVDRLRDEALARAVFLIDKDGQVIGASGDTKDLDVTSLATLAAGNIAASGVIAELLQEREFTTQYHEGERANLHVQIIQGRVILLVVFDHRSSLGLVRLRSRRATLELVGWLASLSEAPAEGLPAMPEITDADIDRLFND